MLLQATAKMMQGNVVEGERLLVELERAYPDREELPRLRALLERKKAGRMEN